MSSSAPSRPESALTPVERRQLEEAHAELRAAVGAYEEFLGTELRPGEAVPAVPVERVRVAQERVEAAEAKLWDLRDRLLGWRRPPWAPPASLVSDWILEDDPGYDDVPDQPSD